jgi:hypothetical protein
MGQKRHTPEQIIRKLRQAELSLHLAEGPPDPLNDPWIEHLVADDFDGPENLWVGDVEEDGLTDLMSGEMGTSSGFGDSDSNLFVFFGRDSDGNVWERRDVGWGIGVSARIRPIDSDGALDFTADGNAEDHIYLWRAEEGALFADGFESGNTSAWDQVVGAN